MDRSRKRGSVEALAQTADEQRRLLAESRVRQAELEAENARLRFEAAELEAARALSSHLIFLVDAPGDFRTRLADLTASLQAWSGCEAVGIRLREGEDFPYCETRGFPSSFVEAERRLCAYGSDGEILRDSKGDPILECMCGNILCGRFDPTKPFFSPHGSFWSNNTSLLLVSTTEADRQSRTRNRCNGEGYESVALIPLRAGREVFGLLQFNDRRIGRFSPALIEHFEDFAEGFALALSRRKAQAELAESERRFKTVADFTWDWETWRSPKGDQLYVSPSCARISGYAPADFVSDPSLLIKIAHPDDRAMLEAHFAREEVEEGEGAERAGDSRGGRHIDFRIITKGGVTRH